MAAKPCSNVCSTAFCCLQRTLDVSSALACMPPSPFGAACPFVHHLPCFKEPRHPESAFHFSLHSPPNAAWDFRASHLSLNPSLHTWPTLYGGWRPFQTFAPPNSNPAFDSSTGRSSCLLWPPALFAAWARALTAHCCLKHVNSKQQHIARTRGWVGKHWLRGNCRRHVRATTAKDERPSKQPHAKVNRSRLFTKCLVARGGPRNLHP